MFWRRAFWTRPAFLLVYAVLALACGVGLAHEAVGALRAQRAVDADRVCSSEVRTHCLERLSGTLRGPFHMRKSPHERWSVVIDGEKAGEIELSGGDSSDLGDRPHAEVEVLVHDGRVLSVTTADGATFANAENGYSGVVRWGSLSLTLLVAPVGFVRYARRKSRAYGGWWRSRGPDVDPGDAPVAIAAMTPASVFFLLLFDVPWWAALTVPAVVMVAILVVVAHDRWWRPPGRHAA